jgi:hypothetical protein
MSSDDLRRRIADLEQRLDHQLDKQKVLGELFFCGVLPSDPRERRFCLDHLETLGLASVRCTGDADGTRERWWIELLRRADNRDRTATKILIGRLTQPQDGYRPRAFDWVPAVPPPLDEPI